MNWFWISIILMVLGVIGYALFAGRFGMQKEFRDEAQGFADLLRYAKPIEPGIMVGKGGELMAGFFYRGTDTESASVGELESISARINDALRRRGSGWMAHIDANRGEAIGYSKEHAFSEPVTRMMDEERAGQYNREGTHFESTYAIVFTYLPPLQLETKATALMFERSDDLKSTPYALQQQLVDRFKDSLDDIFSQLATVFEGISRMGEQVVINEVDGEPVTIDHFAGYCHYAATGIAQHIIKPRAGMFYDSVIASQDFTGGNNPRVGRKHIRCLAIEGFPSHSHAAILAALNNMPVAYRWSTRFIFMDPEEGKGLLDKMRKKWRQKVRGIRDQATNSQSGAVDEDALAMEVDAQTAMALSGSGLVRFGHYTSVVVLMDEDAGRLKTTADDCATMIRNLGFPVRDEDVNAVETFLGTLPGHGFENVRRQILHSLNLAHLMPTTATWPGLATNPCSFFPPNSPPLAMAKTVGNATFRLNLHVDDVGHGMLLGPTGAGKSAFLEFCAASFLRYPGARVRKFEKGYSSFVLCNASGGSYFDIGGEGAEIGFAPLSQIHRPSERAWAEDYIETLLTLQKFVVLPAHRTEIRTALQKLAASTNPPDRRTMTDLVMQVQDVAMREALLPYTLEGGNSMIDATSDSIVLDRFVVFEMEHLMNMGNRHVVPVLIYLFRCIERGLDGAPTLLILDEAWLMLDHPMFREKMAEWLRTLRKANCAVWFATQQISDVGNSPIRDVLYASCPTKILLANPDVLSDEGMAKPYYDLGLNERQVELIGRMTKKRDYYYVSPLGRRKFQLGLGPVNLAFVGASGKEDVAKARELIARYGARWPVEWLRWCNVRKDWGRGQLGDWADYLERQVVAEEKQAA
ncbi:transporter [Agrobacterium tumefaciens]|uniref:VirB4 family type IV secretion/conjugal transfer ATPase n=1 Tax=Agrobacterium tumefaciens TaxID=358 RepID=UPI001571FAEA|nr:transporter [Agrobacterium tumefaciens]NTB05924.1 transporter [Agrobacterium tumefaciens]